MTAVIKRNGKRKGKKSERDKQGRDGKRRVRTPKIVAKFRVLCHQGRKKGA